MPDAMTVLQFLTSPIYGCCTTGELMAFNRLHKDDYMTLRKWAEEEMKNRGIEIKVS